MDEPQEQPTSSGEHLEVLYQVTRKLTTFTELDEVVRFATSKVRELFKGDGCALILLDQKRNEFTFPVASQADSGTVDADRLSEIRFPADHGIAGWVLAHDQATLSKDTSEDPRFYGGVDYETQVRTDSILCAPLRSRAENIGVIEVINPAPEFLEEESLRFLEAIGNEVAVAYEKAELYEQLRGEVGNLRRISRFAGLAASGGGVLLVALVAAAHRARVLPWEDLLGRQGFWVAAFLIIGGIALTVTTSEQSGS